MLIDKNLINKIKQTFNEIREILRNYQSFSIRQVRSLESRIIAAALLEVVSGVVSKSDFVGGDLEEAYAKALILISYLRQIKLGKASRLRSRLEASYTSLLTYLADVQLMVAVFQFYRDPILVTDSISWFFPERSREVRLTKAMLENFYKRQLKGSDRSINDIVHDEYLSALRPVWNNVNSGNLFVLEEAAIQLSGFARRLFFSFQTHGCKNTRKFTKVKLLGSGGFGSVYLVKMQNARKETVELAAKVFNKFNDETSVLNELKISRHVQHQNVVEVVPECTVYHGMGSCDVMLTMTYCAKGDLSNFLQTYPNTSDQKRIALAQDVLLGIVYLHDQKIVHMDLNLRNVLISENDQAKICDFGKSTLYSSDQDTSKLRLGCLGYLPPDLCQKMLEQYEEDKQNHPDQIIDFQLLEKFKFFEACNRDIFAFMILLWRIFVNDSFYEQVRNTLKETEFKRRDLEHCQKDIDDFNERFNHEVVTRMAQNPYLSYAQNCQKAVIIKPMVTKFFGGYPSVSPLAEIQSQLTHLQNSMANAN